MKIDFSPQRRVITLDFTVRVFVRDKTHTYLWLRDGRTYGYFLTLDTGSIEVVKLPKQGQSYTVTSGGKSWELVPVPGYGFEKAVACYARSTLEKSNRAAREIAAILGQEIPEEEEKTPQRPAPRPEKAPKPSSGGEYTLTEMATELKLEPSVIRKMIRGKFEKPGARWEWVTREAALPVIMFLTK